MVINKTIFMLAMILAAIVSVCLIALVILIVRQTKVKPLPEGKNDKDD